MKRFHVIGLTLVLLFSCVCFTRNTGWAEQAEGQKVVAYLGLYPQTVVDDDIVYDDLYVLSETRPPDFLDWYYYDENYYAMLVTKDIKDEQTFFNGQKIYNNRKYFFKCEKIKWQVTEADNTYILTSALILDIASFYTAPTYAYESVFRQSDSYRFINDDMLSAICFQEKHTLIEAAFDHDSNYNVNEDDSLFLVNLPSVVCSMEKNSAYRRNVTDYCLAKGIDYVEQDNMRYASYWSANVGCSTDKMIYITDEGETMYNANINRALGIVPVIAVAKV